MKKNKLKFFMFVTIMFSLLIVSERKNSDEKIYAEEMDILPALNLSKEASSVGGYQNNVSLQDSVNGTPKIQIIAVGGKLSTDIKKLFSDIKGQGTKLKQPLEIETKKVGFQWVTAILIDDTKKEIEVKLPVNVIDPATTVYDDTSALDVKNGEQLLLSDVQKNSEEVLIRKLTKSWNLANGTEGIVEIAGHDLNLDSLKSGDFHASFKTSSVEPPDKILEAPQVAFSLIENDVRARKEKPSLRFIEDTEPGFVTTTSSEKIKNEGYEIGWVDGSPVYKYNNTPFETAPQGAYILRDDTKPIQDFGFLVEKTNSGTILDTAYSINKETKTLKRRLRFPIHTNGSDYEIEIRQQLMNNNSSETSFKIKNIGYSAEKIGMKWRNQFETNSSVIPILGGATFKSENGNSIRTVIVDSKNNVNWTVGNKGWLVDEGFKLYEPASIFGVGWETGIQHKSLNGKVLNRKLELYKTLPFESSLQTSLDTKFLGGTLKYQEISPEYKYKFFFGELIGPQVTLEQQAGAIYQDEKLPISGTIVDRDSHNYNLFLMLDDAEKTLISLKEYKGVSLNSVQNYQAEIDGKYLTPGQHTLSIVGIDETGMTSTEKKINVTVTELNGTPAVQKVPIGGTMSSDLKILFKEIRGTQVSLKSPLVLNSSKIGFQWVEATLIDGKKREKIFKIPVNIYDPEKATFNDADNVVLHTKNSGSFSIEEVQAAQSQGTLDQMVLNKLAPRAWNMENGTEGKVEVRNNKIKPSFGNYSADIFGVRVDNGKTVFKTIDVLKVGGILGFKTVPDKLSFENKKLGDKNPYAERKIVDWKIEIENTLNTNWQLNASVGSFKGSSGAEFKDTLVYRDAENKETILTTTNQKISAASNQEEFPVIKWKKGEGLLLKINPNARIGKYKGTINWTLSDAPS